jgi:hypothetical protein
MVLLIFHNTVQHPDRRAAGPAASALLTREKKS